jgi:hypothetical protein
MNEKWAFEVRDVQKDNDYWRIGGLAFTTITKKDTLSTTEVLTDYKNMLQIQGIVTYGQHVEELVRGLTGRLIVQIDDDIDFTQVKYLYKIPSK